MYLPKSTTVLVIDDRNLVKSYIRYALDNVANENFYFTNAAQQALLMCRDRRFDLIVCTLDLGGDIDGFVLYDELKSKQLITPTTAFIVVSAETSPELVYGVLEKQPDDFLVKPFTLQQLSTRIHRVMRIKLALRPVYELFDAGEYLPAIAKIEELAAQDQFSQRIPSLLRLKGEAYLKLEDYRNGLFFFESILELQSFVWAKLGRIRCLLALKRYKSAATSLDELIAKPETKLAALDLMSEIHIQHNKFNQAQRLLEEAAELSPLNVERQSKLLDVCRMTHDYEQQASTANQLLNMTKDTFHRSPEMFMKIARTGLDFANRSYDDEASARVIKLCQQSISELKKQFPDEQEEPLRIVTARLLHVQNEQEKAKDLVRSIVNRNQDIDDVENALDKAKSFHELGFYSQSERLFKQISAHCATHKNADPILDAYLKQEQKERAAVQADPKALNNTAVFNYNRRNFTEALKAFRQAFLIMPKNTNIALNLLQTISEGEEIDKKSKDITQLIKQTYRLLSQETLSKDQIGRFEKVCERLNLPTPRPEQPIAEATPTPLKRSSA